MSAPSLPPKTHNQLESMQNPTIYGRSIQKNQTYYPICQHQLTLKLITFGYEEMKVRMGLGLALRQTVSTSTENNLKTFIIVTPNNMVEKAKPHLTTFQATSGFIEISTFFFPLYICVCVYLFYIFFVNYYHCSCANPPSPPLDCRAWFVCLIIVW